jgi:hypothetical protein
LTRNVVCPYLSSPAALKDSVDTGGDRP